MNFKINLLNNKDLIMELKSLVKDERQLLIKILNYLKEVDSRRLYAFRGHDSLFSFAMKELNYSAAAAHRRISAMRLIKDLPEVQAQIESGKISLSNASSLRIFFVNEDKKCKPAEKMTQPISANSTASQLNFLPKALSKAEVNNKMPLTKSEKSKILKSIEGLSTRNCEKHLASISNSPIKPKESQRAIGKNLVSIRFTADSALMDKLNRLKSLLGSHLTMEQLILKMTDLTLKKMDPIQRQDRRAKRQKNKLISPNTLKRTISNSPNDSKSNAQNVITTQVYRTDASNPAPEKQKARNISQQVKDNVFIRFGGKCCYKDPITGQACGSKNNLNFDHKKPFALNGSNAESNLQILCNSHNMLKAISEFGETKMNYYLKNKVNIHKA